MRSYTSRSTDRIAGALIHKRIFIITLSKVIQRCLSFASFDFSVGKNVTIVIERVVVVRGQYTSSINRQVKKRTDNNIEEEEKKEDDIITTNKIIIIYPTKKKKKININFTSFLSFSPSHTIFYLFI